MWWLSLDSVRKPAANWRCEVLNMWAFRRSNWCNERQYYVVILKLVCLGFFFMCNCILYVLEDSWNEVFESKVDITTALPKLAVTCCSLNLNCKIHSSCPFSSQMSQFPGKLIAKPSTQKQWLGNCIERWHLELCTDKTFTYLKFVIHYNKINIFRDILYSLLHYISLKRHISLNNRKYWCLITS